MSGIITPAYRARTAQNVKFFFAEEETWEAANWMLIPGVGSASGPSFSKAEIDVTPLDANAKEFLVGLADPGSLEFTVFFDELNEMHNKFLTDTLYKDQYYWIKMSWPTGFSMVFKAQLMSMPLTLGVDAATTSALSFRISGQPVPLYSSGEATIDWDSTLAGVKADGSVTGNVTATMIAGTSATAAYNSSVTVGDTFTRNIHYSISGVPNGLTPVLTKTSASVATLTFTGNATSTKDISNISIQLMDAALENVTSASSVDGYQKAAIAITFA